MSMFKEVNAAVHIANSNIPSHLLPFADVPAIDFSKLTSDHFTDTDMEEVVEAIVDASMKVGFMNIIGHNIPQELISKLLSVLREFFSSEYNGKKKYSVTSSTSRGYQGYGEENINAVLGRTGLPPDMREVYSFGPDDPKFDQNIIPEHIKDFKETLTEYYGEMEKLEILIFRLFSKALSKVTGKPLDSEFLFKSKGNHRGLLRANYYPKHDFVQSPLKPNELGCAPHTDWSTFSILLQQKEGLEMIQDGQWRRVPVVKNAFTVNVGDQLRMCSNGKFLSGIHQVNPRNYEEDRISVVFFSNEALDMSDESRVEVICVEGETPNYESSSIKEYLRKNFYVMKH